MTLSLEEISARLEIADLQARYSYGVDHREWSEWATVFSDDAVIDYSHWGVLATTPAELRDTLSQMDSILISAQHLTMNAITELNGDTATSRIEYFVNGLMRTDEDGQPILVLSGGWYLDQLRRTEIGWRIIHRKAVEKWAKHERVTYPLRIDG